MENAVRVTKKGGVTLLVAECRDGIGPPHFVDWLKRYNSSKEMEEQLLKKFEFGAHKSFFLCRQCHPTQASNAEHKKNSQNQGEQF